MNPMQSLRYTVYDCSLSPKVPESCCRIEDGEQTDCNDKVEGAGNKVQPQLAYSKVRYVNPSKLELVN